jgi:hypothetical protein
MALLLSGYETRVPFRRHWAYEWQLLVESVRPRLNTEPLRFWHAGGLPKGHYRYAAADTVISEIYRSLVHTSQQLGVSRQEQAEVVRAELPHQIDEQVPIAPAPTFEPNR